MHKKAANTKKNRNKNACMILVKRSHSFYNKSFQSHLSILLLMYLALDHVIS